MGDSGYDFRETAAARSPWLWRGFLVMSLIAIGVALIMVGNGRSTLGIMWGVIAVGWFGFSMLLWRLRANKIED